MAHAPNPIEVSSISEPNVFVRISAFVVCVIAMPDLDAIYIHAAISPLLRSSVILEE
jgi:hypothetical protein